MRAEWLKPRMQNTPDNIEVAGLWRGGEKGACRTFCEWLAESDTVESVLDIGAGYGLSSDAIAEYWPWCTVTSFDYQQCGSAYPGPFVLGDAHDLSCFSDGQFDAVWSAHCVEHLQSPFDALLEWRRVLGDDGFIGLAVPSGCGVEPGHIWDLTNPRRLWYLLALTGFAVKRVCLSGNTLIGLARKTQLPSSLFSPQLSIPDVVEVVDLCA